MTHQSSLPIHFSGWKKRLSLFIAFSLVCASLLLFSSGHAQAASSQAVSLSAAVSYAESYWNCADAACTSRVQQGQAQNNFQCAEFVARALAAAGLIPYLSPYSSQNAYYRYNRNGTANTYNLLWVGTSPEPNGYRTLKDYLFDNGLVTNIGTDTSQASPGDIVLYPGGEGHTAIIVSTNGGTPIVDAHNNAAWHQPYTYDSNPDILHINTYRIVNFNSGKCLDVANYGTGNGDNVQQWDCHSPSTTNQLWIAVPVTSWTDPQTGSSYYVDEIIEYGTDECLDAYGWGTGNGTNVDIWQCGSSVQNNQLWIVPPPPYYYNIYIWNYGATVARGIHVNLDVVCTTATNYGQKNGANVQLYQDAPNSSCHAQNQIWTPENPL
jgi:Ricin-type beta-trefoil lectin domain-like/CHAP domain